MRPWFRHTPTNERQRQDAMVLNKPGKPMAKTVLKYSLAPAISPASPEEAQLLRIHGKLRAARDQLLVCARDVCPAPGHRAKHSIAK